MTTLPQNESDEDDRADDAEDDGRGNLHGGDDRAADEVAREK